MAKNQVYAPSRTRSLPVPDGTVSGGPVMVGSLPVIALTDKGEGGNVAANATCALDGAWRVNVTTNTARSIGQPIFIITATGVLTTTDASAANPIWGYALEAKGTAPAEIAIELAQV